LGIILESVFTFPDAWSGGYYELALELHGKAAEDRASIIQAIWSHPSLAGCYVYREREPHAQARLEPTDASEQSLGIATLPSGAQTACGVLTVLEENGPDWVVFYVPLGSLGRHYNIGAYPFGDFEHSGGWRLEIDIWLRELASHVYRRRPFALGLIGAEASGECYAQDIHQHGLPALSPFGFLVPMGGKLNYTPAIQP
jgi:hypothetical protein